MKVLIIDDEIGICKYLQRVLKKEGCKVNYTTSAVGVMDKIYHAKSDGEPYELLLLDLRMPTVGGLELLKEIREAQLDLDVIIITGYGDEEKVTEAVRLGAVDYLPKPISLENLQTAVFRVQQKRVKEALRHSILIVDDEKDLCNHIKRELDKEGYQTAVAYDGDEGLGYFRNNKVDMVIADIKMPKMSGLEMLKKCREITDDFVSIIITGHGDHEKAIEALKLDVFNYLRKPISLEELVTSIGKGIDLLYLRRGLSARKRELEIETALKEQYAKNLEEKVKERTAELDNKIRESEQQKQATLNILQDVEETNIKLKQEIQVRIKAEEKAKETDRLKSAFLNTMSHELRTPLNAVIGFSEIINKDIPIDEILNYSKTINDSGIHLLKIVDDIFDITMIESGEVEIQKEEFNITTFMDDIHKILKAEQEETNKQHIDIYFNPAEKDKDFLVYTDRSNLKRILINLLKNALKFTHEGNIEYGYMKETQQEEPVLKFYVKDTGIGISEHKLEIIFDIFRQADDTDTRLYGGTGIGLSVSRKLVELLGGKIWVDTEEGKGSTFYFTLPYRKPDNI